MFRQWFLKGGLSAMALAALLWASGPVFAQHHGGGGGHGGGGHGGGHAASFHGGGSGWHGGSSAWHGGGSGWHGGWNGGRGWYGGYGHRGYWPYWYGLYGLGFGYYPYNYGYYPSYYGYDSYPYSYYPEYSSYYYEPSYNEYNYTQPQYYMPSAGEYGQYPDNNLTAPAFDNQAHIRVLAPASAQVWFENQPTTETGSVRQFVSPPLTPGKAFTYHMRAQWMQNGRAVNQVRNVDVFAGTNITVDFTRPAANSGANPMTGAAF
jgi:uncharacterized protein (TIGR03000 family)